MTAAAEKPKSYTLGFEEKATPVMVYTASMMAWGEVVTKELIRVGSWLRMPEPPRYVCLYDCQLLYTTGAAIAPIYHRELHIPVSAVTAFHLLPPHKDPIDYDETEPNRKMEPVSALIGPYRFDGLLRMSTMNNLKNYLELMTEKYTSLYEVVVSQPQRPNMKPLHIPFALIHRESALFSAR